jgi:hypothetical protein
MAETAAQIQTKQIKPNINVVAQYSDEGFAILEDQQGKFVAFRDRDDIVSVDDPIAIEHFRTLTPYVSRSSILT